MAQPTFAEYRSLSVAVAADKIVAETMLERWLTCLAAFASQQNPDGSTFVHP